MGKENTKEESLLINDLFYYEVDAKIRPVVWLDLEIAVGYRNENWKILYPMIKTISFGQVIFKPLPNLTLDFKIKRSSPEEKEYGGTIGEAREGDFREWTDQYPDYYAHLVVRLDF